VPHHGLFWYFSLASAGKAKFNSFGKPPADGSYLSPHVPAAFAAIGRCSLSIIERSDVRFKAGPHRWIVERTFAWRNRHRRLIRDLKETPRLIALSPQQASSYDSSPEFRNRLRAPNGHYKGLFRFS
jgi:transposase